MHGKFDPNSGQATGDDLFYIYPDMETGFYGKFNDFVMEKASAVDIVTTGCSEDEGLPSVTQFRTKSEPLFYYQPPTNIRSSDKTFETKLRFS